MKLTTKVPTLLSVATLATVSASCANQKKAEQAKRCEAGEALVSQELEKIDVLAMKAKSLYQKAMKADENT